MEPNQTTPPPEPKPSGSVIRSMADSVFSFGEWLDVAWQKIGNLTETNFRLATDLAAQGRVDDAIWRLRITLWIAPDHLPSWYNLGCLYLHKGMSQEALQCFSRVLKKQPTHEHAIYMVATINPALLKPEVKPHFVPLEMISDTFNQLAPRYEAQQRAKQYQLPTQMYQLLHTEIEGGIGRHDLLDLGCGTGVCGALFQETFNNMVGVDLSNAMLDIAYRKMDRHGVKIYNRLVHRDLRFYLKEMPADSMDVVLCLSVFPYLGNLESTFGGVAKVLRPGAYFACSFDPFHQPGGYGVMPQTGYFGHDINYVLAQAQAAGLETVRTGEVPAYPKVHVQLCFFRKPKA